MYTAKWFRASVKTPKAGDQVIILLNPPSLHHNTTIGRYLVIENQFSRTLKIACITLDSNWTLIWHCLCLLMALETPPPLNLIEKMTGVAHLIGWHKWQGWQGCPTWWYWRLLAFLSPSGDLGIGLVWDNHPTPPHWTTTFRSDCWNPLQTELNYLWRVLSCSQDNIRWF